LSSQAVTGAIFEIIQRLAAAGEWDEIPRHLPQLAYIATAPFTTADHAIGLVEHLKAADHALSFPRTRKGEQMIGNARQAS
jgi:hypothetical protein